jgi:hypothetical protein
MLAIVWDSIHIMFFIFNRTDLEYNRKSMWPMIFSHDSHTPQHNHCDAHDISYPMTQKLHGIEIDSNPSDMLAISNWCTCHHCLHSHFSDLDFNHPTQFGAEQSTLLWPSWCAMKLPSVTMWWSIHHTVEIMAVLVLSSRSQLNVWPLLLIPVSMFLWTCTRRFTSPKHLHVLEHVEPNSLSHNSGNLMIMNSDLDLEDQYPSETESETNSDSDFLSTKESNFYQELMLLGL